MPRGLRFQPVSLRDLGRVLGDGPKMLAVLFTTSLLTVIYVVYTFLSPLLSETMGWGRDGITLALVVYGVGAVAGNLMGGMLADRIGAGRTLFFLAVTQVCIMPAFSFLPMPPWLVFVLLIAWPLFGWSFMTAQQMRLLTLAPRAASVVLALNAAAIYVGAAIGSAIGGQILSGFGLQALGIGAAVTGLIAVAHIALSRRMSGKHRHVSSPLSSGSEICSTD